MLSLRHLVTPCLMALLFTSAAHAVNTPTAPLLKWSDLPALPDTEGWAGMYAGVSNGVLIAAGGSQYANGIPWWQGGQKTWSDRVFYLESPDGAWKESTLKLPRPMGNGASLNTNQGLLCIGGADNEHHYADVFQLAYKNGEITLTPWTPLPEPRAAMSVAILNHRAYLAGGIASPKGASQNNFWSYDLNAGSQAKWQKEETWPGSARHYAVAAVQDKRFFLVGGKYDAIDDQGKLHRLGLLSDTYCYTPPKGNHPGHWKRVSDAPHSIAAAPSPAPALGHGHFAILGGGASDPALDRRTMTTFGGDILLYHAISDTWSTRGHLPTDAVQLVAPVVTWSGKTIIVGGEDAPASRSSRVSTLDPSFDQQWFGWINWIVVGGYFLMTAYIGYYFSRRRDNTTRDFFLAGNRIPWWAAGISIFGTQLSAQSFMGNSAIGFADDWSRWLKFTGVLLVAPLVIYFYLPFYRRLKVTSVYEYLERRFGVVVRLYGSVKFIVAQLIRIGVLLYLPAVALSAATGIDVYWCLVVITAFTIFYTALGGMEAVIWTDVIQVVVLLGGAVLCLGLILYEIGGVGNFVSIGLSDEKFNIFDWRWDPTSMVVWVLLVGPLFINLGTYTTDQTVVQRYLTTKDEKGAAKSILTNAAISIPISFLFLPLGTALYIFYQKFPEALLPGKNDAILPQFIVHQLPPGIAGLVIAAVFAATMSSLDSSMNSISTAYVSDFYKRFSPHASEEKCMRLARWLIIVVGLLGLATAWILASTDIRLIVDRMILLMGLMGGGLTGIFMLGIFTTRANSWGAMAGAIAGFIAALLTHYKTDINLFLFGAIGAVTCVIVGYIVSLITPDDHAELKGLTIHNMLPRDDEAPQS